MKKQNKTGPGRPSIADQLRQLGLAPTEKQKKEETWTDERPNDLPKMTLDEFFTPPKSKSKGGKR